MENKNYNYRLKFVKYTKTEYVLYLVRLICIEDGNINVEFFERFSNLKDLHDIFKKEANSINFPKFPPKKFFGSTDEKFLNQRMIALELYFNTILGSKEFSSLPSLKKWVDTLIRKYNKGSTQDGKQTIISLNGNKDENKNSPRVNKTEANIGNTNVSGNVQSFVKNNDLIQKYRDVVDKYSKSFIDLGSDNNPHVEIEESINKEKNYRMIMKSSNALDITSSKFFKLVPGDNTYFDCLGLDEPKVALYESQMLARLNTLSKNIVAEIPEEYNVEGLVVKININDTDSRI